MNAKIKHKQRAGKPMYAGSQNKMDLLLQEKSRLLEQSPEKLGAGFVRDHSLLFDEYFREAFAASQVGPGMSLGKNPLAMVALGGYGRQEMCVHSDVDILVLFAKKVPDEAEQLVREMVYPLWDAGLDVGHATRTPKECLRLAAEDYQVLMSLLDARFVGGASNLYTGLMEMVRDKLLKRARKKVVSWIDTISQSRQDRFGDSTFLLEPNIKEGQGGLRDYHSMLWAAMAHYGLRQPRDLEFMGLLTNKEYQDLEQALDFLWTVRNNLHLISNRHNDVIYFEHQPRLAQALEASCQGPLDPVENFLGALHGHMAVIKDAHRSVLRSTRPGPRGRAAKRRPLPDFEGLCSEKGFLYFQDPDRLAANPALLVRIFEASARHKLLLSLEARRLVREFSNLITDELRTDPACVHSFEYALFSSTADSETPNEMLRTGILTAFIPEMAAIVNRVQYTQYHVYPVDKHSLMTLRTLKDYGKNEGKNGQDLQSRVFAEVTPRRVLYMAGLLHDVGKGDPGPDHSARGEVLARQILTRMGWPEKQIEMVAFLVREHLSLVKTATRRDLNDEQTALSSARMVGDVQKLRMLFLISTADSKATGEKAWNPWTQSLLDELFFKVYQILTKGRLATRRAVDVAEKKRAQVLASAPVSLGREKAAGLFEFLSPRYLNDTPSHEITAHLELFQRMGEAEAAVMAEPAPGGSNMRVVTVCAKDRPGLFSRISGVLALNNINILDARIYTWQNRTALDVFRVQAPLDPLFESRTWDRVQKDLQKSLAGEFSLEAALAEKLNGFRKPAANGREKKDDVRVDNETSGFFTLIEVLTYDRLGLLHAVTNTLFKLELDVWVAKIATKADQVVDVFYVRDLAGQKVDEPGQVEAIRRELLKTISAGS